MSNAKDIVEKLSDPMQSERVHLGGLLHLRFYGRNSSSLILQSDHPAGEGRIVASDADLKVLRDVLIELYPLPANVEVIGKVEDSEESVDDGDDEIEDLEEPEDSVVDPSPKKGRRGRG